MMTKTTRMSRTRMRTRGKDDKEDKDEGQQGGQQLQRDKDLDNEGQRDIVNHKISLFVLYTVHSINVRLAEDLFLLINP